jgi:hypothetical protein
MALECVGDHGGLDSGRYSLRAFDWLLSAKEIELLASCLNILIDQLGECLIERAAG